MKLRIQFQALDLQLRNNFSLKFIKPKVNGINVKRLTKQNPQQEIRLSILGMSYRSNIGYDTALAQIIHSVRQAQNSKPASRQNFQYLFRQ